jgi:hypothetical protein
MFSGKVMCTEPAAGDPADGMTGFEGIHLEEGKLGVGRSIPRGKRSSEQMKRKSMFGLCVVVALAAFAISAMAASSASAGTYYNCVAKKNGKYAAGCKTKVTKKGKAELSPVKLCVAKKKGKYTSGTCTTLAKPNKGKFEKVKGPAFTASTGEAILTTEDLGSGAVKCKKSATTGEITGEKTDVERVVFTECEFEGLPCESAGEFSTPSKKSGVIDTNLLDSKLIDHGEKGPSGGEPAVGETWEELVSSEHEPYQAEFNCAGVVFLRTLGTISGAYTAGSVNVFSATSTILFEKGKGEQDLGTEALTESGWVGPFPSNEQVPGGAAVVTTPAVEVRT